MTEEYCDCEKAYKRDLCKKCGHIHYASDNQGHYHKSGAWVKEPPVWSKKKLKEEKDLYWGCRLCGKPIASFKKSYAYAIGCFWQEIFCTKKCALKYCENYLEKLSFSEVRDCSNKIDKGFIQKDSA